MANRQDYSKQRRNQYGESPHGSRKSIPRAKRRTNRASRRRVKATLESTREDDATQVFHVLKLRGFTKLADVPLGSVLIRKAILDYVAERIPESTLRRKLASLRKSYPAFTSEYRKYLTWYIRSASKAQAFVLRQFE